jgi:hypothetical protein
MGLIEKKINSELQREEGYSCNDEDGLMSVVSMSEPLLLEKAIDFRTCSQS